MFESNMINYPLMRFSNWHYSKGIFFDEKKKRFVDFDFMDHVTYDRYKIPFSKVINIKLSIAPTIMVKELRHLINIHIKLRTGY